MATNPQTNYLNSEIYPALYETVTIYSDLAKTVLNSFIAEEYEEPEKVRTLVHELLDVAETSLHKIEPGFVSVQWARKRIDPEGWQKRVDAILNPPPAEPIPFRSSILERAARRRFWDGVDIEEPAPRRSRVPDWGLAILGHFKHRPLTTTDVAKVLFGNEFGKSSIQTLQVRANNGVLKSEKIRERLADQGLELIEIGTSRECIYVCREIGAEAAIDRRAAPSDVELRSFAVFLRESETDKQKQEAITNETEAAWQEREADLDGHSREMERAAELWYSRQKTDESFSVRDRNSQIREWQAEELVYDRQQRKWLKDFAAGKLEPQLEEIEDPGWLAEAENAAAAELAPRVSEQLIADIGPKDSPAQTAPKKLGITRPRRRGGPNERSADLQVLASQQQTRMEKELAVGKPTEEWHGTFENKFKEAFKLTGKFSLDGTSRQRLIQILTGEGIEAINGDDPDQDRKNLALAIMLKKPATKRLLVSDRTSKAAIGIIRGFSDAEPEQE